MTLREYAKANKVDAVKVKGRNLMSEMNKEGDTRIEESENCLSVGLPKYSTPAKNLRAEDAAASELEGLTGEAHQRQQDRVNELVRITNRQNEELLRANPERAGASKIVHSAVGNLEKSAGAALSPHGGPRREEVVTLARRNKQIVPYDLTRAGKAKEVQRNDDRQSVS